MIFCYGSFETLEALQVDIGRPTDSTKIIRVLWHDRNVIIPNYTICQSCKPATPTKSIVDFALPRTTIQ
jgi:hypothetical protein